MFAHAPVPYIVFKADGHPLVNNRAYREMFAGEPPPEYNIHQDEEAERSGMAPAIRRAFAGETVHTPTVWYDPKRIKHVPVTEARRVAISCTLFPLRGEQGRVTHVAIAFRDVTDELTARERAEQERDQLKRALDDKQRLADALAASDERLRQTLEAAEVGTWEWNIGADRVEWSPNIDRIFGLPPGTFAGTYEAWLALVHPDDKERMAALVADTVAGRGPYNTEFRFVRPDGSVGWQATRGYVVQDEQGRPRLLRGVVLDITSRRSAEEAVIGLAASLRESEHQLRLVTDGLPALVAYFDSEVRYRFVNRTYERWFGLERAAVLGKTMRELLGDSAYAVTAPYVERALTGEALKYEREFVLPGGRAVSLEPNYIPDRDEHGRVRGFIALVHDITDRRQAQRRIEAQRRRFEDVLTQAPAAISIHSGPELACTFVNPVLCRLVGGRPLLGRPLREGLPDLTPVTAAIESVLRTGEPFAAREQRVVFCGPDGPARERFLDVSIQALRDEDGGVEAVVTFAVDVTEQVAARAQAAQLTDALTLSESRYRAFVGQSTEGIWRFEVPTPVPTDASVEDQIEIFYRDAYLAECNDAMARMYGYDEASALVGRPLGDLLVRSDPRNEAYLRAFIESGYRLEAAESHERDAQGRERVFENALLGIVEDGRLVRAWGTQRDVTAQHEARARAEALATQLRQSEAQLRTLADSIPQLAWVAGPDGRVSWLNRRWYEYTGATAEDIMNSGPEGWWQRSHGPTEMANVQTSFQAALAAGEPWEATFLLRRADGQLRAHLARAVPVRDDSGQITRWFGTHTDVEDQRQQALALEQAVLARDTFLSVAGHELKTPLTALALRIGQLRRDVAARAESGGSPAEERKLDAAETQVRRLSNLVDGLLDVSRIGEGRLALWPEPLDLVEVVKESIETLAPQAQRVGSTVHLDAPPRIRGAFDRVRLGQVVTNLLANALKFGAGAPVVVEVRAEGGAAFIIVRDEGIGIPADVLPRLFGKFERGVSERNYGGLGLGLFVTKQLVEAMGGTVSASSSAAGQGATFAVELPIRTMYGSRSPRE